MLFPIPLPRFKCPHIPELWWEQPSFGSSHTSSFTQHCAAPTYWDEAALTLHLGTSSAFWPSLHTIHHWERMPLTPVTPLFYLKRRAGVITWLKFPVSQLTGAFFCTRSEETGCESITVITATSAAQARLTQVSFWWASMKSRCVAVRYSVPVNDLLLVLNRSSNFTCSTWKRESVISHYKVI